MSQVQVADRLQGIQEYYFSKKLREIESLNREGKNIINLGIGSPDLPPDPAVIATLYEEALKPGQHGYQSYKGAAAFRQAIADWYKKWYGVDVAPEKQILPLMGSKEGIMHICMTYLNPGDQVLVPNPGYPTYASNVALTGAEAVTYALTEENGWEPDFEKLEKLDFAKIKLMFVNYPGMPTGRAASRELFEKLIGFAKRHEILLVHDNPYSFILNDHPISLLSVPGALEVAIELNSLSKSHNMAGWRLGMLLASEQRILEILRFKSNMDSGMFLPLQLAAAKALTLDKDFHDGINKIYSERRKKVEALLTLLDCRFDKSQVGLFMWAKISAKYKDGYQLADEVLYGADVFITPGGIFGSEGDKYIRISLCGDISRFETAIARVEKMQQAQN
ncbi:aminotransferase class I/II-fold pyridoxal phosphate-dependent enzyme [Arachidicoccus ginsenosidivorans]|jgi:aspartate/methionine/tyrosine aminotransferase|uniref:Aminotransferase n=1 Tax=Arachidicoccus ginsenosidivorans TaxID=496057 RepID=A0A5B8VPN8_9BACT|nr:aminotransferase class I/II-fold pyridoxal phosphate-dependent enzyme [Arachidicoccus ginsenosidivorans]QEC72852.1 aminotransferase class I/II-fold pyridoxal phosphate-dependent enzyme [Arachidicoccus ginsenosidivorans]